MRSPIVSKPGESDILQKISELRFVPDLPNECLGLSTRLSRTNQPLSRRFFMTSPQRAPLHALTPSLSQGKILADSNTKELRGRAYIKFQTESRVDIMCIAFTVDLIILCYLGPERQKNCFVIDTLRNRAGRRYKS